MSLIAVTSSQGLSILPSTVLRASHPDPAPTVTTALTPPSRIPSSCIFWSPDAATVYVASGGSVSAYDPSGAFIRDVVREGEGGIGGAKLGSMVVLETQSGTDPVLAFSRGARAVVFDSETRRALQTVEGHRSSISTMSLAQDQSLLATSSGETTIITNLVQQTNSVLRGAPSGVVAVAFHPTRRSTLLLLSTRGLHVFDTTKGTTPTRTIPIGKAEAGTGYIAFSPIAPTLVAILVPGGGGRVLMLDIEKESSLVKKFTVEENVSAMSFSHDGGSIIVGTEIGRVLQLNLRSIDKPAQAVVIDSSGGRIGGLSLVVASAAQLSKAMSSSTAKPSVTSTVTSTTRTLTRPARAESVTSTSTSESVRVKSTDPRTPATKLRVRPSTDILTKSPDIAAARRSPDTLRRKASGADMLTKKTSTVDLLSKKPSSGDLLSKAKTSPSTTLRVKQGVESKPRPTSMIGATGARERVGTRIRPVSMAMGEGKGGAESPAPKSSSSSSGTIDSPERAKFVDEPTVTPSARRQTQTMPRRLTAESNVRPSLSQVFAQDDLGTATTHSRSRSTSYSSPTAATPVNGRPTLASTTPSYTPVPPIQIETTTPGYPPEDRRERPLSRARSRLGNDVIEEEQTTATTSERPPMSATSERPPMSAVSERPASRLFKDEIERPSSRVGAIGLGRPTGTLGRRFSTAELAATTDPLRIVSESGVFEKGKDRERERPASVLRERPENLREREGYESLRERPQSALRERPESIFRERTESLLRDRPRSGTPLSASAGRTPGKRVGWIDEESPYIEGVHTPGPSRTPPPSTSGLSSDSASDPGRNRMLQVTPRRGLAAALGAEVYADDAPNGPKKSSSSITQAQAQDLLRNIVSDVMFEYRQEAKEDVRGLHLDLIRASRGWKHDLKEYLGDTLDELREVKEENARLRAEIARLKRGY
ncbi:hypothetical protein RhiJN_21917 [Ceratobasidium sp. AG-Ba]|nr:hypothetical protein RhiJN_21917 [Ceratobasidium sp. AG-Ba]